MSYEKPTFPLELWEANYDYPTELFEGLPKNKRKAWDEKTCRMAKFAVAKSLDLACRPERLIKASCLKGNAFRTEIRKVGSSHTYGEIYLGDVEIMASLLGVYEYIGPLDEEEMRTLEAEAMESASHQGETLVQV